MSDTLTDNRAHMVKTIRSRDAKKGPGLTGAGARPVMEGAMAENYRTHICSFDAVPITPRMTYEAFKKQALAVGRFSVFEATANKRVADLFTRLCNDPEVEIGRSAYPWTLVRERKS